MLKPILLGTAMLIATPALAQTTSTTNDHAGAGHATAGHAEADSCTSDTATNGASAEATAMAATGRTCEPTTNAAATGDQSGTDDGTTSAQGTTSAHAGMNHATTGAQGAASVHGGISPDKMGAQGTNATHVRTDDAMAAQGAASAQTGTNETAMAAQGSMGSASEQGPMTGQAVVSGSGGINATSSAAWDGGVGSRGMGRWTFGGDLGRIGSADWGMPATGNWNTGSNAGAGAQAGAGTGMTGSTTAHTGMGGPLDIDAQWSTISSTGGELTPLEFGTWLLEQNGHKIEQRVEATARSRASNLPAIQVLNLTAGAFGEADMNNDMRISRDELRAFAGM